MHNRLFQASVLLACVAYRCLAEEGAEPVQQTQWREEHGVIPSVYWPLRLPTSSTRPADTLPEAWTEFQVNGGSDTVVWDPSAPVVASNPTSLVERRIEAGLTWRQSYGVGWLSSELEVLASHESRSDSRNHFGDPQFTLCARVMSESYASIAVTAGTSIPVGDKKDWLITHGDLSDLAFGPTIGLRGAFAVGMLAIHINGSYMRTFSGENTARDLNGDVQKYKNLYQEMRGGVSAIYQVSRVLGLGVEGNASYHRWQDNGGDTNPFADQHVTTEQVLVTATVMAAPAETFLRFSVGQELSRRGDLTPAERLVISAGLSYLF